MSSTLRFKKVCEHCKQTFIAHKTTTKYCSHKCNSRAYKANVKQLKTKLAAQDFIHTTQMASQQLSAVQLKQFLDIQEVCILLKCSESTLRKLISKGSIPTRQIGRKHIIRRTNIDSLFGNTSKDSVTQFILSCTR